ncbi:hypothetical protein HETIRDRAFT_162817 [Heterobasidion irregulare TC 32-1]|uniref:Uncharacterized protein n=1 Tax=Heterobasidion irregulare (strain TC 32-1) TaxID=747525 RepID=W4JR59_HETIT|nr:uncharacterized protein HETIRDRAFT_162817 [Heterobasidion irregulare TC 32-1]ETW76057.1 hypothetical protein HETIRDRAFT_162817 [Heterobasidion irregulare TC 32-1]
MPASHSPILRLTSVALSVSNLQILAASLSIDGKLCDVDVTLSFILLDVSMAFTVCSVIDGQCW